MARKLPGVSAVVDTGVNGMSGVFHWILGVT